MLYKDFFNEHSGKRLTLSTLLAYGFPAMPLAAMLLPVYIYLPAFYAQQLGLGLAAVGFVRFLSGIWDVGTDPIIGLLSDKSKNRFGRRKIYILLGLPVTMAGTWMLLVPTGDDIDAYYMMLWSCIMYLGWTMMMLPLTALSTELSTDYHERSRIAGFREAGTIIGTVLTLGMISYLGLAEGESQGEAVRFIAIFICTILPISTAIFFWRVPDPQHVQETKIGFRKGLSVLKSNKPFRILIFCYLFNAFSNGLVAILSILFVENVIGSDETVGPYLFAYFVTGMIFLPLWVKLARKIGKHKSWSIAMAWACLVFAFVPFVDSGDSLMFMIICILTGASVGADLALPSSMQADVVDYDLVESGERRAGLYFALWGMSTKLSLAIAAGIAFPILDWVNFPDENAHVLLILFCAVPILVKLLLIFIMWFYPLNKTALAKIQSR